MLSTHRSRNNPVCQDSGEICPALQDRNFSRDLYFDLRKVSRKEMKACMLTGESNFSSGRGLEDKVCTCVQTDE